MNLDFMIPMTAATARKLTFAATMMKLDLDPKVIEMSKAGLVDVDTIGANINCRLTELHRDDVGAGEDVYRDICQHAADNNMRFSIVAKNTKLSMAYSLIAALSQGDQVLIVDWSHSPPKAKDAGAWQVLLRQYEIPYKSIKEPGEEFDPNERILLVDEDALGDELLGSQRHRVCIHTSPNKGAGWPISPQNDSLLGSMMCEFPKFIAAIASSSKNAAFWWNDTTVKNALTTFYQPIQVSRLFNINQNSLNALGGMGFTNKSINSLAKLIGINLDLMK